MRTLLALLAALAAACSGPGCRRRAPPARPNVVVIAVEGLSVRLGCYGRPARTPHADRLASRGRRFERAYRPYPELAASRASWTSGKRPERAETGGPPLSAPFEAGRYAVASVTGPTAADAAREAAKEITRLQGGRAQDRPFFVFASLPAPPAGWLPPPGFLDPYSVRDVQPEPPVDPRGSAPAIALADHGEPVPPPPPAVPADQQSRRAVADLATASYLDAQVGVVLAALDAARLWDSTVVVLVGESAAAEVAGLRPDLLREDALRVPLVVAAPGFGRPGRAAAAPVDLMDVRPTLADLAGLSDASAGRSLRPLLESPGAPGASPSCPPCGARRTRWRAACARSAGATRGGRTEAASSTTTPPTRGSSSTWRAARSIAGRWRNWSGSARAIGDPQPAASRPPQRPRRPPVEAIA